MMKKIEAQTLEEAYALACDELGCSMTELRYEIVQYPSKGILGLFAKPAIIVAATQKSDSTQPQTMRRPSRGEAVQKSEPQAEKRRDEEEPEEIRNRQSDDESPATKEIESSQPTESSEHDSEEKILEGFFAQEERADHEGAVKEEIEQLAREIESKLKELMQKSCFDIDVVEVDVIDATAYIFMDGEDAALVIGKEGYRYNALSYLLYNWIHGKYGLHVKLEVASFLSTQEEMIRNSLESVIEHVRREGWGRTRSLDGILVQIALEQLREAFPDKYVAVKRHRDGKRYVLVNEFHKRR